MIVDGNRIERRMAVLRTLYRPWTERSEERGTSAFRQWYYRLRPWYWRLPASPFITTTPLPTLTCIIRQFRQQIALGTAVFAFTRFAQLVGAITLQQPTLGIIR